MRVVGYRPNNDFLRRPVDVRWRAWVTRCCIAAVVLAVTLGALVVPRQENVRLRYEIARLTHEVASLDRAQRRLSLEREALASPAALAAQLEELGLAPLGRDRVAYLGDDGKLHRAAGPPAARPGVGR